MVTARSCTATTEAPHPKGGACPNRRRRTPRPNPVTVRGDEEVDPPARPGSRFLLRRALTNDLSLTSARFAAVDLPPWAVAVFFAAAFFSPRASASLSLNCTTISPPGESTVYLLNPVTVSDPRLRHRAATAPKYRSGPHTSRRWYSRKRVGCRILRPIHTTPRGCRCRPPHCPRPAGVPCPQSRKPLSQ